MYSTRAGKLPGALAVAVDDRMRQAPGRAVTVLLARIFLAEPVPPTGWAGLMLTVAALQAR